MKRDIRLLAGLLLLLAGLFVVADSQSLKPVFFKLKDIKDVSTTAATNGQVLTYNSTTGLWEPSAVTKSMVLKVMAEATVVTSGDGKMYFTIPVELNGMNLVSVGAHVYTADDAQNMDIDIYNVTQTTDMLSTAMRIEANEKDTATSAQAGTIDTSNDDVATGDEIRIDVTTFTGILAKGLEIRLGFRL